MAKGDVARRDGGHVVRPQQVHAPVVPRDLLHDAGRALDHAAIDGDDLEVDVGLGQHAGQSLAQPGRIGHGQDHRHQIVRVVEPDLHDAVLPLALPVLPAATGGRAVCSTRYAVCLAGPDGMASARDLRAGGEYPG